MRLKSHTFKKFGILALAGTIGVLPGPTVHAVEIAIEPPTAEYPAMLWHFLTDSLFFMPPYWDRQLGVQVLGCAVLLLWACGLSRIFL